MSNSKSSALAVPLYLSVAFFLLINACATMDDRYYNLSPESRYYRVKQGDTLYGIARRSRKDYLDLARWNRISKPYRVTIDSILVLFPPDGIPDQQIATPAESHLKPEKKGGTSTTAKTIPAVESKAKKNSKKTKKKLKVRWAWPLKGVIARDFSQTGRKGLDIVGKYGAPVKAAAAGEILYGGQGLSGYGNLIILKHSGKFVSAYGNNSRLLVKQGDMVHSGQTIAEVGVATDKRAILHFEIRKDGKPVNPVKYLPKP